MCPTAILGRGKGIAAHTTSIRIVHPNKQPIVPKVFQSARHIPRGKGKGGRGNVFQSARHNPMLAMVTGILHGNRYPRHTPMLVEGGRGEGEGGRGEEHRVSYMVYY